MDENNICCYFNPECDDQCKENCGYWDKKSKCPQETMNKNIEDLQYSMMKKINEMEVK